MKLAAIDIGSNAARLLIAEHSVDENGKSGFQKLNLLRVPLRLGFDVFESNRISPKRYQMLLHTLRAYKNLLEVYEVKHLAACATSAMRDAENGPEIIRRLKEETGIDIEIISGDMEAGIIFESQIAENLSKDRSYLYIDVGGGSTELNYFSGTELLFKESFNIGTIRLLKNQVKDELWDYMREKVKSFSGKTPGKIVAIGSGGNINKVFSLSKRKEGKPLMLDTLRDYYKELSIVSLEERKKIYKLREDRADVILPALSIYINVMKWADIDEILVPKVGLADGLIHHLFRKIKGNGNNF